MRTVRTGSLLTYRAYIQFTVIWHMISVCFHGNQYTGLLALLETPLAALIFITDDTKGKDGRSKAVDLLRVSPQIQPGNDHDCPRNELPESLRNKHSCAVVRRCSAHLPPMTSISQHHRGGNHGIRWRVSKRPESRQHRCSLPTCILLLLLTPVWHASIAAGKPLKERSPFDTFILEVTAHVTCLSPQWAQCPQSTWAA